MPEEIPLRGGNLTAGVVRVGDTVRRPAGPWTPSVHALLTHLHERGFTGAPRPHGLDERGREVLEFVEGEVLWPDRAGLLDPLAAVARVARLVRDFHDAVAGFTPPPDACWQRLIPADRETIIAHHDLAPWNLVAGPDRWVFIDWDTAAPGSPLWDVAYAVHGVVPLVASAPRADAAVRLRCFADAYGLDEAQREELVPMLARRTRSMHDFLVARAAVGDQPWARLCQEGHAEVWLADTEFAERSADRLLAALLD